MGSTVTDAPVGVFVGVLGSSVGTTGGALGASVCAALGSAVDTTGGVVPFGVSVAEAGCGCDDAGGSVDSGTHMRPTHFPQGASLHVYPALQKSSVSGQDFVLHSKAAIPITCDAPRQEHVEES